MASIFDLRPRTRTVQIDDLEIPVYGIGIGELIDAIGSHGAVSSVIRSDKQAAAIVAAILAAGGSAINKILAAGLHEDADKISQIGLTGVDQVSLLAGIVDASMPDAQLGKAKAEVIALLKRLGLVAEEKPAA